MFQAIVPYGAKPLVCACMMVKIAKLKLATSIVVSNYIGDYTAKDISPYALVKSIRKGQVISQRTEANVGYGSKTGPGLARGCRLSVFFPQK